MSFSQEAQQALDNSKMERVRLRPRTFVSDVLLEAAISVSHEASAEVTLHPVEEGASVSDHVRPMPETIQLTGVITDHPLFAGLFESDRPASDAERRFLEIVRTGEIVTITTTRRTFKNYAVTRITFPQTQADGLTFSLTAQEIRTVSAQQVDAPDPIIQAAKPKTSRGNRPGKTADASTASGATALFRLTE